MAGEDIPSSFRENTLFSTGIHPWYLTEANIISLKEGLILTAAHPHVVALGEGGYDMLRGAAQEIQHEAFLFQAEISEEMEKPLIIHCVRAWEQLTAAFRRVKPVMPWIIHGFRGKAELASSLAGEGFWFSLGIKGLNQAVLTRIPRERILLETDDGEQDISEVYDAFSRVTGLTPDMASQVIRNNFTRLFSR